MDLLRFRRAVQPSVQCMPSSVVRLQGVGEVVFYPVVMEKLRLDDVVDAVTVHGFCGAWGTLAAGLFFENNVFNAGSYRYKAWVF